MTDRTRPGTTRRRLVSAEYVERIASVHVRRLSNGEIQVGGTLGLPKEEAVELLERGLSKLRAS